MAAGPVRQRLAVVADAFRSRIWPLPTLGILVAAVLGVGLPLLDHRVDDDLGQVLGRYLFTGGPDAARSVLSAISGSLVTLTSLTFSLTVVTLQLASSQFSPRLLRTFSSDRFVHLTLALFVSTFTYSLTVLRTVRSSTSDAPPFVPQISVTVALVLALSSVLALVLFLAHLASEIRVETMLRRVHNEARATILRVLDERDGPHVPAVLPTPPADAVPLLAPRSGFLTSTDEQALLAAAAETGTVLLLERPPGSSLVVGTPIGWGWPLDGGALADGAAEELARALGKAISTAHEHTSAQDVTYGFKQITDVAAKALSPGINDPRTAVHALGHSAALLALVAGRDCGPKLLRDEQDRPRVYRDLPDLEQLLDLAIAAPRRYGAADPDVLARLLALLAEVAWSTDVRAHRDAVRGQLARLQRTVSEQSFDDVELRRLDELAETVRAALLGRHRSPARAVVS